MRVRGEGEGRSGTVVAVSMWWRWRVCVGVHECLRVYCLSTYKLA